MSVLKRVTVFLRVASVGLDPTKVHFELNSEFELSSIGPFSVSEDLPVKSKDVVAVVCDIEIKYKSDTSEKEEWIIFTNLTVLDDPTVHNQAALTVESLLELRDSLRATNLDCQAHLLVGQAATTRYYNGDIGSLPEASEAYQDFYFKSKAERDAFSLGCETVVGWSNFANVTELEDIKQIQQAVNHKVQ